MNNFKKISLSLFFLFFTVLLQFNCTVDKNPVNAESDLPIVGEWKVTFMSTEYQGVTESINESQLDSIGIVWNFRFENDSTMEMDTNMSGPLVTMPGTWSITGNDLTTILTTPLGSTGTMVYKFAVEGNLLKLDWEFDNGRTFYSEHTRQ